MANVDTHILSTIYSGEPTEKLTQARRLFAELTDRVTDSQSLAEELKQLSRQREKLDAQMASMAMGPQCSACAARPGGGCCSALMADNTDAIQILINLLLGVIVEQQPDSGDHCCFLGPQGCLFAVKPIFCLNYNCSHILDTAEGGQLDALYRRVAAVLRQQTRVESLLLEFLRERLEKKPLARGVATTRKNNKPS